MQGGDVLRSSAVCTVFVFALPGLVLVQKSRVGSPGLCFITYEASWPFPEVMISLVFKRFNNLGNMVGRRAPSIIPACSASRCIVDTAI